MRSPLKYVLSILTVVVLFGCSQEIQKRVTINPEFAQYISAYTSGIVSRESSVKIMLTDEVAEQLEENDESLNEIFRMIPEASGSAKFLSSRMIEFIPSELLESGVEYTVFFDLGKLQSVPENFEEFSFQFKTIEQDLNLYMDGLSTYQSDNLKDQKLSGRLVTADICDSTAVNKTLSAYQDGKELEIEWNHDYANRHRFVVHHVSRKKKASEVKLLYNGKPIGVDREAEELITVHALGDFKITNMSVVHEPEQYALIHFSDPIKKVQELDGLIKIDNVNNLNFEVEGHDIKVFLPYRLSGTRVIHVSPGIKNINGYKMLNGDDIEVGFEGIKPNIKLVGDGTIIPNSGQGYVFPFEAVNLRAVDVYVTKVFENNMVQFLQVNNYSGTSQMKRIARNIMKKRVDLTQDGTKNQHQWNKYFLDLSDIIGDEPGTIHQIELRFKKEYSVYQCGLDEPEPLQDLVVEVADDSWSESDWVSGYYYDDYYYDDYYDDYDYDYRERENPCNSSYYRNKYIKSNVLTSDLGIIAKAGSDKKIHVFLSDLRTTENIAGATIEFYDFQQQKIGSTITQSNGMSVTKLDRKPFLIIAKKGNQRGYLKLRDGESLSLSKFDVSGSKVQKGVKGFLYTERGVWRPGDSIYLSFILEDRNKVLPSGHPVKFKLYNPHGQLVDQRTSTRGTNGHYDFWTSTDQEDITGSYRAEVRVGNRVYNKYLKVETVKPNRLKIYMNFEDEMLGQSEDNEIKLSTKWLHGAVAKNLRAKVDLTVNSRRTSFAKHGEFVFDDPLKSFSAERETVLDELVDDNGEISFDPNINIGSSAPGMLTASFSTKVFEEGGGFSVDSKSIKYSPYESYVGVKTPKGSLYRGTLVTDKEHEFEIATVDAAGKPVSRKNVDVKVYKIEWRWWWDSYDNDLMSYISRPSTVPVFEKKIATTAGKGKINFEVKRPSWGRYYVRIEDPVSGHVTGKVFYVDWPYWARANRTENENATMLSFSTDKETYSTREKVKISFPSPSNGKALVCIESGTKVIEKHWVKTKKGETKFEFTTSKEMAPNVFVHVSLLQPHKATQNDLPIRMYGVVPISVENPDSHLHPVIKMKDVLKPETTANITVQESDGKPMTYTLAIVDEGLLDLTGFKTPEPWDHFYTKEALGVKTWDLYDDVMGSYTQEMSKLLAIGGDADGGKKKPAKANRFKPMVRFMGPFKLKSGGRKTHKVDIPNYIGSVRVMVVAGQDKRYGHTDKTVPVRSPLMVLGTLPRVLGPGEELKLPVNIFAMEKHVKNVSIEVKSNDLLAFTDGVKKSIKFNKIGDEVVNFPLKVKDKIGIARVEIIARSGKEIAKFEIELDVRTPNPMVADVMETIIQPGEDWNPSFAFKGIEGTNSATIEMSAIPPMNLEKRLKYLIRYPHGCIEQTTSSVFPQLFVDDVMQLDNNHKIELDKNIKAGIDRLKLFQTSEGGFAYWPGQSETNEWGSNYGGHFLMEAEKQGYKIPNSLKTNWLSYQRKKARNWKHSSSKANFHGYSHNVDLTQAYRLYTLALAGKPELSSMNRMKEVANLSSSAKWRLAGAYVLVGRKEVARQIINNVSVNIPDYVELSYTFGSSVRDEAMILEVLALLDNKTKGGMLAKGIAEAMNKDQWMSTQTTAYALVAMSKFIGISSTDKTMRFTYNLNGGKSTSKSTILPIYQAKLKVNKTSTKMKVSNTGKGMLYAKLIVEGIPVNGDETAAASNLAISVSYSDMDGNSLDPSVIEQGTDFVAAVTVTNPGSRGYLREMTLNQIFPSGWEIHNTRMQDFKSSVTTSTFDYQDIRDDRVYTYYRLRANSSKTFRVQLNATYQGKFYLPTIESEAMYDNTINARTPGKWVQVVQAGESTAQNP